jgi:predicted Zn finger-like uncharacterized protein
LIKKQMGNSTKTTTGWEVRVVCPECKHEFAVSAEMIGVAAACPKCKAVFKYSDGRDELANQISQGHRSAAPTFVSSAKHPPEYESLVTAAFVLRIIGILSYIAGALLLFVGIAVLVAGAPAGSNESLGPNAGAMIGTGVMCIIGGALQQGFSAAFVALRDMARNSFK